MLRAYGVIAFLAAFALTFVVGGPRAAAASRSSMAAVQAFPEAESSNDEPRNPNTEAESPRVCVAHATGAVGCFQKNGDVWFLKDLHRDHPVEIYWQNLLWNPYAGRWEEYRHGYCTNGSGPGTMVACDKNYYEDDNLNEFGGTGSMIGFEVCIRVAIGPDPCSVSGWFRNDA